MGFAGETAIEEAVALLTIRLAEALREPEAAVIVMLPGANPEANPARTTPMVVWDEVQLT
jgi:hypothetical protein